MDAQNQENRKQQEAQEEQRQREEERQRMAFQRTCQEEKYVVLCDALEAGRSFHSFRW